MKTRENVVQVTWQKTKIQNLVRHKSGRYYARAFEKGKEVWKSLKTPNLGVAKVRLAEFLGERREVVAAAEGVALGTLTLGQCIILYLQKIDDDRHTKPETKKYWRKCAAVVRRTWPDSEELDVRKIVRSVCEQWAKKLLTEEPYTPPGTRAAMKRSRTTKGRYSPRYFNHIVDCLRHILDIAVEAGALAGNPASSIEKAKVKSKELVLPSSTQFTAFVREIENGKSRFSKASAELVQLLAFTGMRIEEATWLTWADCNFDRMLLTVRGNLETGTKNSEIRFVPMIPAAKTFLERLRVGRELEPLEQSVARVSEAQQSMTRAARKVKMPRITHHDLRHYFATICIESGVDIPTVSRWLGHKDGGVLAMKTYGHLRQEHSLSAAQKVLIHNN